MVTAHTPGPAVAGGRAGSRSPAGRPSPRARRLGYLVSIAVNVALIALVHGEPGWRAVPFLTAETALVLPWVTAQLLTSIAVNLVWVVVDPRWLRALGEAATAAMGLAAALRVLTAFPFAFDDGGLPWATLVRVVLWVGVVGSALGVLVNLVRFVRAVVDADEPRIG